MAGWRWRPLDVTATWSDGTKEVTDLNHIVHPTDEGEPPNMNEEIRNLTDNEELDKLLHHVRRQHQTLDPGFLSEHMKMALKVMREQPALVPEEARLAIAFAAIKTLIEFLDERGHHRTAQDIRELFEMMAKVAK